MAKSLADRIASASKSPSRVTITDLEKLIADVRAELDRRSGAKVHFTAQSVDFTLDEQDRDEAAAQADKAGRDASMLASALEHFEKALVEKRNSENRQAKEAALKEVLAERDALAQRIKEEYPRLAGQLAELFEAIEACESKMLHLGSRDLSPEAMARECSGTFYIGPTPLKRLTKIQLPALTGRQLLWPSADSNRRQETNWQINYTEGLKRAQREAEKAEQERLSGWFPARVYHSLGYALPVSYKREREDAGVRGAVVDNESVTGVLEGWFHKTEIERLRRMGVTVEVTEEAAAELANA